MAVFVYKITNLINNKAYIGVAQDPDKRFEAHCKENNPSVIASAIRKYKKENFEFKIISIVPDHNIAFSLEKYCIHKYSTLAPNGYNLTKGGEGGDTLTGIGYKHSAEVRAAISKRRKGVPTTLGYKMSEETKLKISKANTGKKRSKELCEFISTLHTGNMYNVGRKWTEERRKEAAQRMKGNSYSKGNKLSDETRKKMSIATKKYWDNKREVECQSI